MRPTPASASLFAIGIALMSVTGAWAQTFNVKDKNSRQVQVIEDWMTPVRNKSSYGGCDLGTWVPYNRWASLLFSDRYFIPVFGKAYDELTNNEREKIGKALVDCMKDKKLTDDKNCLRVIYPAFDGSEATRNYMLSLLKDYRDGWSQYQRDIKSVTDPSSSRKLTRDDQDQMLRRYNDYLIFPAEYDSLDRLCTTYRNAATQKNVEAVLAKKMNLPDNLSSAIELRKFITTDRLEAFDYKEQKWIRDQVQAKLDSILSRAFREYALGERTYPDGEEGFLVMENDVTGFTKLFGDFHEEKTYKEQIQKLMPQKTRMMIANLPVIKQRFEATKNIDELYFCESRYLTYADLYTPAADTLIEVAGRRKEAFASEEAIADRNARDEQIKKILGIDHILNFRRVTLSGYFESAYVKDYKYLDGYADNYPNLPLLIFKRLLEAYSDSAESSDPSLTKEEPIRVRRFVRTEVSGVYPRLHYTDIYEWVTVKTIHIKPLYANIYERGVTEGGGIVDLESAFNAALHPQSFIDNAKMLLAQNDEAGAGARALIKENTARHPGIQTVMANFYEYLSSKWRTK